MSMYDHDAERMILSAVIHGSNDLKCWEQASAALGPEHFHEPRHALIWAACERAARCKPIALDAQLVMGELGSDHAEAFLEATRKISTPRTLGDYVRRVRELATVREVGRVCGELFAQTREGPDDVRDFLDNAPRLLNDALRGRMLAVPGHTIGDVVGQVYDETQAMIDSGGTLGLTTGLRRLDAATLGLVSGDLVVVAGRPGMGKSALAQHMLVAAAREGHNVLAFSLEMPRQQWAQRMIAAEGRLGLRAVRNGDALRHQPDAYRAACEVVSRLPIHTVDTPNMTAATIAASARAFAQDKGRVGLVVVDYLQLMTGDRRMPREQQVSDGSRSMKLLARELDCPVVLLSQLNRGPEQRGGDKRPQLSDLRESGAIEQDADEVLFVHRPGEYDREDAAVQGFAEIIIGKCRNGATGIVHVAWVGEHTLFADLPQGWTPPQKQPDYGASNGRRRFDGGRA